jgi:hypothetical protein
MASIHFEDLRLLTLQRKDNFVIVVASSGSADVCSTSGTLILRQVWATMKASLS